MEDGVVNAMDLPRGDGGFQSQRNALSFGSARVGALMRKEKRNEVADRVTV